MLGIIGGYSIRVTQEDTELRASNDLVHNSLDNNLFLIYKSNFKFIKSEFKDPAAYIYNTSGIF